MSRKLFGTDGIRGRANIYPMTGEVAFTLGRAVTAHFQNEHSHKKPVIIIGKDTRLSCYMLEQAFSSGVCAQGGHAILTGPLPTPGVAFVTQSMRADAGVMISASHNAFYDNGIKIFDPNGNKLSDKVEKDLEEMLLNPSGIPVMLNESLGKARRLDEVVGRYIVKVKSSFNDAMSLEGLRLVVDGANGAAYKVAPMIFEELGAEVLSIGNTPNGMNINKDVGALYPKKCSEAVVKYRADLGICLDGDADRLVMIDRHGEIIDGDKIIGLLAYYLHETKAMGTSKEVVGTVMSNLGLENYIKSLGMDFHRSQVGDRYILQRMKESHSLFGGEPSGHIIFKDVSTTGDGILSALKVVEAMRYFKKDLHQLLDEIHLYPQVLLNIEVEKKPAVEKIKGLPALQADWEKKLGNKGRILIRYSGTESLCRVMVEGEDGAVIKTCAKEISALIKTQIGV